MWKYGQQPFLKKITSNKKDLKNEFVDKYGIYLQTTPI